jgi:archaellum component FlaC
MSADFQPPSEAEIMTALTDARLLSPADAVRLQRYPANFSRRDERGRIAFRVWIGDRIGYHLTVGASLKELRRKTAAFAQANPEIACKPLFFFQSRQVEFFGQEYFGQGNLEEGLAQKRIDLPGWQAGVMAIKTQLLARSQPSSPPKVLEEINALEKSLLALEWFSPLDETLLRAELFPLIRQEAAAAPRSATWTNGDFVAKNILFDGQGGYRLIDCEFAGLTHFEELDWFRLQHFSTVPHAIDLSALSGKATWPKWLEILGWLQHLLRLCETLKPNIASRDIEIIAERLTGLLRSGSRLAGRSVFFAATAREAAAASADEAAGPTAQLFWPEHGQYSEERSSQQPVRLLDTWADLLFDLPTLPEGSILRLDPSDRPGYLEISRIAIESLATEVAQADVELIGPPGPDSVLIPEGDCVALGDSTPARFILFGGDPILRLPPIPAAVNRARLRVNLRLSAHAPTGAWAEAMRGQQQAFFRSASQGHELRLKTETEIASLRQGLGGTREQLQQAADRARDLEAELGQTAEQLRQITKKAQGLESALAALRSEHVQLRETASRTDATLGQTREQLQQATDRARDLEAELGQTAEQLRQITEKAQGLEGALAALRSERDEFVESLHAQNAALLDYEHRSVEAAQEFKRLDQRLEETLQAVQRLEAALTRARQQFDAETALRERRESELTRLRQRFLVRVDAALRREKPRG